MSDNEMATPQKSSLGYRLPNTFEPEYLSRGLWLETAWKRRLMPQHAEHTDARSRHDASVGHAGRFLASAGQFASDPDGKAAVLQFPRHTGAAIGLMRKRVGRTHMRQHHHVLDLPTTCWHVFPGKIAAPADTQNFAVTVREEFCFRLVDATELHRLPSLAKKVAARFNISSSCRRISFSLAAVWALAASTLTVLVALFLNASLL
jgi:hypothetical protein